MSGQAGVIEKKSKEIDRSMSNYKAGSVCKLQTVTSINQFEKERQRECVRESRGKIKTGKGKEREDGEKKKCLPPPRVLLTGEAAEKHAHAPSLSSSGCYWRLVLVCGEDKQGHPPTRNPTLVFLSPVIYLRYVSLYIVGIPSNYSQTFTWLGVLIYFPSFLS